MKALIIAAITGIVALCLLLLLKVATIKVFFVVLSFVLVIAGFLILGWVVL